MKNLLSNLKLNQKNLLLALLAIVTVTLTIASYLPRRNQSNQIVPQETTTITPINEGEVEFLPAPTPTPLSNIQIQQLESDGVAVDELYENNPTAEFRGDTTIASNNDYSILFFAADLLFQITVYTPPFDQTQKTAEKALLTELGVTEAQACRLKVSVIHQPADFSQSPTTTNKLSFCP